jgi:hypothetical protein
MDQSQPGLSSSDKLRIEAGTKKALVVLRDRLIAWWRKTEDDGFHPGWSPDLRRFAYKLSPNSALTPPEWMRAFEEYATECFDGRASAWSKQIVDPPQYVYVLGERVLPEVLSLIEGGNGLWPSIMVQTREAAGFHVRAGFSKFIEAAFEKPGEHLQCFLKRRIQDWDANHLCDLSEGRIEGTAGDGSKLEGGLSALADGTGAASSLPAIVANDGDIADRRRMVDAFLLQCNQEPSLSVKVIRKHIWHAVGHKNPRQFQYWQAGDDDTTAADTQNFSRVLAMHPAKFVALLRQKGLLKTKP